MKLTYILFCCILFLSFFTCSKPDVRPSSIQASNEEEETVTPAPSPVIDSELRPYYESFIEEMQTRGIDLSYIPISILFVNTFSIDNNVSYCGYGYANFENTGSARVEILRNSYNCWDQWNTIQRQNLMYHEFGHALLSLPHIQGELPNGSKKSLMCDCFVFSHYTEYQDELRDYYLDELLNSVIDNPNWATTKTYNNTLYEDSFTQIVGWESQSFYTTETNSQDPFIYFIEDNVVSSPPYALGISAEIDSETEIVASWYKDFPISDFDNCSNLVATINGKATGILLNGFINMYLELYDDQDAQIPFGKYQGTSETTYGENGFFLTKTTALCLPEETVRFRILFSMKTDTSMTAYFDDLKIDLYE